MGRSVLITGSGTGLGLATALHLAKRGMRVYATVPDRGQRPAVEAAAAEEGVRLHLRELDVTDSRSVDSAVQNIVGETGEIYGLVNNAGLGLRGFFEDLSDSEIRELFEVNVFGVFAVTRAVLPHMRARRSGRIVIISSAGGRIATMTLSAYCAGKFALEGFGESLAMEVAPFGIQVSMVEPGPVMTPHFTVNRGRAKAAVDPSSPYYGWFVQHESMVDRLLGSRRILPVDVAKAVHRALTARRPRLRYVVGKGAKVLISLRRRLPGELFEKVYQRQLTRMVTRPRKSAPGLSQEV